MTSTSRWDTGMPTPQQLRETAREARQLPREAMSHGVRVAVAGALGIWLVTVVVACLTLPERVPTHWSGTSPDGWSSKLGALTAFVIGPAILILVLRLVSLLVLRWPQGINAPNKEYWIATPTRLRHFERLIREDMTLMGAWAFLLFAALSVVTAIAAHRPGGQMPGVVFAVIMVAFIAGMLAILVRILLGGRYRASGTAV